MMRATLHGLILIGILVSGSTVHAGAVLRSGESIHLRVGGHSEAGRGLRAEAQGWRLQVAAPEAVVELSDVTANATPDKWVIAVAAGQVMLDAARFRAGHAYRVEVRRGATTLKTSFVYLYPPRGRASSRMIIDASGDTESASDEIAIAPKSAL